MKKLPDAAKENLEKEETGKSKMLEEAKSMMEMATVDKTKENVQAAEDRVEDMKEYKSVAAEDMEMKEKVKPKKEEGGAAKNNDSD